MTVSTLAISPAAWSVGQYARASANTVFAAASRPARISPQPMKSPDSAMVSTPTCGEAGRSRHWPSASDWRPCWDAALVEPGSMPPCVSAESRRTAADLIRQTLRASKAPGRPVRVDLLLLVLCQIARTAPQHPLQLLGSQSPSEQSPRVFLGSL